MKRFLIFVFALFTFGTAYADEYTILCQADYYFDGYSCKQCPSGTTSAGGTVTECIPCPNGTYSDNGICTACPDGYPNSDPGATDWTQCYSDITKYREWDGTVRCQTVPENCESATCTICDVEPEPCAYVAYAGNKVRKDGEWVYEDGDEVKFGCATNPCITNIVDDAKLYGGVYNSESNKCELCAPGTYFHKDVFTGIAECIACPDGKTSVAGATSSSQCIAAVCDAGYYLSGTTCTKCPDEYPNSEVGSTKISQCYSNTKLREWTGEQTETLPLGCADATFGECQIDACEYVEYYGGMLKSGCETNNKSCTKPILSVVANSGYIVNGNTCEACPAGTYSNTGTAECMTCPENTYSANGATECTPCAAGYISNPGAKTCVATCPAGSYIDDDGECKLCPAGTYNGSGNAKGCTECPDDYSYSDAGATNWTQCYSDWKTRICQTKFGCDIAQCQYKVYAQRVRQSGKWVFVDGDVKEGCTESNCLSPSSMVAFPGYYVGNGKCEKCPAGTYSTGGENAQCIQCPKNKSASMPGATSADECGRILNYRAPNADTPTQIFLGTIKNTSPALAVGIGNDIFYANMTPVNNQISGNMYVGYNDKIYGISSNVYEYDFRTDAFYITTTPDTDSFEFSISATGNFTVDWGDRNIELLYGKGVLSHKYDVPGKYTIELSGKSTEYTKKRVAGKWVYYGGITFSDTTKIARIGGSLGAVFPTLDDGMNPSFHELFKGATNLTGQIPQNLFAGIYGSLTSSDGMYQSVFEGCSGLTGQIPVGLFGYLSGDPGTNTFVNAFKGCTGLTGPTARNPDGTPLYDIEYDSQTWLEYAPSAFTDMYTDSGIISDF